VTERHLDSLVEDTNKVLKLLESLSVSFRAVEDQTASFQSQCEDLLSEQERLQALADDVGTDLHYYAYLDNATRRLNAPGASRLVDNDTFAEVLDNLDACIAFMMRNVSSGNRICALSPGRRSLLPPSPRIEMQSRIWHDTRPC
jgi:hypothetical protein